MKWEKINSIFVPKDPSLVNTTLPNQATNSSMNDSITSKNSEQVGNPITLDTERHDCKKNYTAPKVS